jgi:Putative phage abortive infection protein
MLRAYLSDHDREFVNSLELRLNDQPLKMEVKKDRNLGYLPFEGHQSRLGHYYRHLYQMVRFVENNASEQVDVLEHMRTIQAQLSTHEQALLLLNSLTPMGGAWWNRNLIDRHFLVHNIPKEFFDPCFELDPSTLFDPGYFETVEQHARVFPSMDFPFKSASSLGGPIWRDTDLPPGIQTS